MYDPSDAGVSPDGAADLIKAGGVVIFPTETFFGMGGRALDADATARVYRVKRRSNMHPLPLVAADESQLELVCRMPDGLLPLLRVFWPGPLTAVLPARLRAPEILSCGTGTVAVRVTAHPVCRDLALAVGEPLTASSANISGKPPVTRAEDLDPDLIRGVDGVLCAPPAPNGGDPSTLIEPQGDDPRRIRIVRPGAISAEALTAAGFVVLSPDSRTKDAPGGVASRPKKGAS
jgi:L-threonylcarbamoyladenylate synthase